jgi:hypothetical protein
MLLVKHHSCNLRNPLRFDELTYLVSVITVEQLRGIM